MQGKIIFITEQTLKGYAAQVGEKLKIMDNRKKILVIDDDKVILQSIEKQLKHQNLNLDFEDDPVAGLGKIMKKNYDLVLCDIKMKSLTGLEVLKEIKSTHPEIPVIILTGYVDDKIIEEARNLGCDDFLFKPLRKNILINSINKIFKL